MITADDIEWITERAGIMEYAGGLPRDVATITAFMDYAPAYFRQCVRKADGDQARLLVMLEELIIAGIPAAKTRQGIAALEYIISKGIKLIGQYDNGAQIASGDARLQAFTSNMNVIRDWTDRGIKKFMFVPADYGLIVFDIDIKNGKDGVKEFYDWCLIDAGKSHDDLPIVLQNIPHNHPCFVTTPSGGYHLYFRFPYKGVEVNESVFNGKYSGKKSAVEIKYKQTLTAPGSYKDGLPYISHGNIIEDEPVLHSFLITAITRQSKQILQPMQPSYNSLLKKEYPRISWTRLRDWVEKYNSYTGHNDYFFHLTIRAKLHGYTEDETLYEILNDPYYYDWTDKNKYYQIKTTVNRVYSIPNYKVKPQ